MDIKTICVVGAGNMGHQIALQAAISGYTVYCTDINEETLQKAEDFATKWVGGRLEKGKLTTEEADAIKGRINFTGSLETAAKDADFVIEAAIEILKIKRELFANLDKICPPHTILATNSSYIVSSKIADATSRPDKVLNMHWFNPALVMKLVEVVKGPHTSEETVETVLEVTRE